MKKRKDPRFKYSPTHSEPAVCCAPNYARNYPYFLEQMWMKSEDGIAAVMYGPSALSFLFDDTFIKIEQKTKYPFSDEIEFIFQVEEPKTFTFHLRKPSWSKELEISEKSEFKGGYYGVNRTWKNGDKINVKFKNSIEKKQFQNGESYIQRGALVYAYEIPHEEKIIKTYDDKAFNDYHCFPTNNSFKDLSLNSDNSDFKLISEKSTETNPWYNGHHYLQGNLYNHKTKSKEKVKLVPMGSTVLRRVTFPKK